jgi:hypothetical protein
MKPNVLGAVFALTLGMIAQSHAAIKVYMNGWDRIPLVVVTMGNNQDCGANPVIFSGSMTRGQPVGTFAEAGSRGVDICWRRTADPLNPTSPLQSSWTRCSGDGDCIIS